MKCFALPTLLTACVPMMLLGACAADQDPTDSGDLESAQGGLTMDDEAPQFGDPAAFEDATVEAETAVTDPMASTSEVVAMDRDGAAYRAVVLWGQLPPDRGVETATTWTGSISLNRGAIVVRRTIGFEDRTDAITPRTDRRTVAFTSVTRPAADGLALLLLDPTPAAAEPLTLTYTPATGDAHSVAVAELLAHRQVLVRDGLGNRMVAVAMNRVADGCEHGFLRGVWRAPDDGRGGFIGQVTDEDMHVIGHVRGHYGERRSGEHVFFGKFIALDGKFRGILAGSYGEGSFAGIWRTRAGEVGGVQGEYSDPDPSRDGGVFLGRWADKRCALDLGGAAPN